MDCAQILISALGLSYLTLSCSLRLLWSYEDMSRPEPVLTLSTVFLLFSQTTDFLFVLMGVIHSSVCYLPLMERCFGIVDVLLSDTIVLSNSSSLLRFGPGLSFSFSTLHCLMIPPLGENPYEVRIGISKSVNLNLNYVYRHCCQSFFAYAVEPKDIVRSGTIGKSCSSFLASSRMSIYATSFIASAT